MEFSLTSKKHLTLSTTVYLMSKLNHYGIRGISNNWFKFYLNNRTQCVSIQGSNSDIEQVKHGVPHGSVLRPLVFLLYINDLNAAINYSPVYHFSDDTNLLKLTSTHSQNVYKNS